MLPRSGEITAPWPVPLSATVTIPSSRMPALSHFRIRRMMRLSPTRCSKKLTSQSWLTLPKKSRTSAYVVHLPTGDRHRQSIQRIVRPSSGSEPVWEPEEILLVDGVEHHDAGALDDLVLQSCDRQRPLPTIRLRYLRPARPFLPLRSPA